MSPLVLREICGVLVDTLPTDAKYRVEYYENLRLPIEIQLAKKRKPFLNLFFHLWTLHQILNILERKDDRHR